MRELHFVDQYTEAWWKLRLGKPTASQFHRIVTKKGELSSASSKYLYELVAERIFGKTVVGLRATASDWAERGARLEPEAIEEFSRLKKLTLKPVGLVTNWGGRIGSSPDCLVEGSVAAVEIKCPSPPVHIGYLLDGPGEDYKQQVQGHLLVGEWDMVHFFSYMPGMVHCWRQTHRDEKYIETMSDALDEFCDRLDEAEVRIRAMGPISVATVTDEIPLTVPGVFPWH